MARPLRLDHPGALWHLTSRGNEKRMIFMDDEDRMMFLSLLATTVMRFRWLLHEFVLMGNHYHLVAEMVEANVSRGMQWLNGQYARYFNRRYGRCGHLFQGRFKGKLVDSDEYLLEVCRYVVLNPVRAGLVGSAGEWAWSSYRAKAGLEEAPAWLVVEPTLARFGRERKQAQKTWQEFVTTREPVPCPWEKLTGQIFLGGPMFVERMQAMIDEAPRSTEHPKAQRNPGRPSMHKILRTVAREHGTTASALRRGRGGRGRMVAAHAGWHEGRLRLREIAEPLGLRSAGYVSTLIRRCAARAASDGELAALLASCRAALAQPPPISRLGGFDKKY
ncbi:MAG: transposase [Thermoanaerobaculia bacterium]